MDGYSHSDGDGRQYRGRVGLDCLVKGIKDSVQLVCIHPSYDLIWVLASLHETINLYR